MWLSSGPSLRFAEIGDQPFCSVSAPRVSRLVPPNKFGCAIDHKCRSIAPFCDGRHTCKGCFQP